MELHWRVFSYSQMCKNAPAYMANYSLFRLSMYKKASKYMVK